MPRLSSVIIIIMVLTLVAFFIIGTFVHMDKEMNENWNASVVFILIALAAIGAYRAWHG